MGAGAGRRSKSTDEREEEGVWKRGREAKRERLSKEGYEQTMDKVPGSGSDLSIVVMASAT